MSGLAVVLALVLALWAVVWLVKAPLMMFTGERGKIIAKSSRRWRKNLYWFLAVLTVIGLLAAWVTPKIISVIVDVGRAVEAGAGAAGDAGSAAAAAVSGAAGWFVDYGAVLVGVVLAVAYWAAAGVWIGKVDGRGAQFERKLVAGGLFAGPFVLYVWLFIA